MNLKTGVIRKQSKPNFPKTNISYPAIHTCTCVYQGVRNVYFSESLVALFLCYLRFEIRLFALLPTFCPTYFHISIFDATLLSRNIILKSSAKSFMLSCAIYEITDCMASNTSALQAASCYDIIWYHFLCLTLLLGEMDAFCSLFAWNFSSL